MNVIYKILNIPILAHAQNMHVICDIKRKLLRMSENLTGSESEDKE